MAGYFRGEENCIWFCYRKCLECKIGKVNNIYRYPDNATFIKWIGIAELDRNLYLTGRGGTCSHWQSHLAATASPQFRQRRLCESGLEQVERELRWPRHTVDLRRLYRGITEITGVTYDRRHCAA